MFLVKVGLIDNGEILKQTHGNGIHLDLMMVQGLTFIVLQMDTRLVLIKIQTDQLNGLMILLSSKMDMQRQQTGNGLHWDGVLISHLMSKEANTTQ